MEPTEQQPRRILVADDDHSIRSLVATIVRREGLQVDAVADGGEAIDKIKEHQYAVILLDLMMPRVDGFEVIDYLSANPPGNKPVVLVITAYADQKFKQVNSDIVSGIIRKPFEVADLGNLIRLCVSGYDAAVHQELLKTRDRAVREVVSRNWSSDPKMRGEGNDAN